MSGPAGRRSSLHLPGNLQGDGLGYALYFGATCRACPWEWRGSFSEVTFAAEQHAKKHGAILLVGHKESLWRGRPIVDIWKEDGMP